MTIFNPSAFASALLLGLAGAAFAAAQGDFDNMFTENEAMGKDVRKDCSAYVTIHGKTYCLGDEHTKSEFMKHLQAKTATYY